MSADADEVRCSRKSLVLVAALGASCGEDGVTVAAASASWEQVPDPPLGPRVEAAVAWTGREIVVVGGNDFLCGETADCGLGDAAAFADGAAFHLVARKWRPIADAPVPVWSASTVRLGDEIFFLGVSDPRKEGRVLLRYDVVADEWDTIELPGPMIDTQLQLAATDSSLVLYPGSDEFGPAQHLCVLEMRDPVRATNCDPALLPARRAAVVRTDGNEHSTDPSVAVAALPAVDNNCYPNVE